MAWCDEEKVKMAESPPRLLYWNPFGVTCWNGIYYRVLVTMMMVMMMMMMMMEIG